MYDYIKGEVVKINSNEIILENNGIGYKIQIYNTKEYKIKEKVKIYTYYNITPDSKDLYGFKDEGVRTIFELLIKVPLIGPKTALSILKENRTNELISAIHNKDYKYLKTYPGIGDKTSKQIILELHDKIPINDNIDYSKKEDVYQALKTLGFTDREIKIKIEKADFSKDIEDIVKDCLNK